MSRCRSCSAPVIWCVTPVIWCVTEKGKRMPVDATPTAAGNLRLDGSTPPVARVVGAAVDLFDDADDGTRYVSHYATCPDSDEWRQR